MDCKISTKKVSKNGNSKVITFSKEVADLGIADGEEVITAIAPITPESKKIFNRLTQISHPDMGVITKKFIGPESTAFPSDMDATQVCDPDEKVSIDNLDSILVAVSNCLETFLISESKDLEHLTYEKETGTFYRSVMYPQDRMVDAIYMLKFDYKMLTFFSYLYESCDLLNSPMLITRDVYRAINDALGTIDDVLTAPQSKQKAIIKEQNADYIEKMKALNKIRDSYLAVCIIQKMDGDILVPADAPHVTSVISNSKKGAESYISRRVEDLRKDRDEGIVTSHTVVGPMTKQECEEFEVYLTTSMKILKKNVSEPGTLTWVSEQFDNYIKSLEQESKE